MKKKTNSYDHITHVAYEGNLIASTDGTNNVTECSTNLYLTKSF